MLDINETTLVQVTNKGTKDLKLKYASRPYLLKPGKKAGVPYYAAALWFGNPLSIDQGGPEDRHLKERSNEVDRLSTLYGLQGAPWTSDEEYTQTDLGDDRICHEYVEREGEDGSVYWHPNLPNVEVTDTEGETLPVVVTDPEGEDITPAQVSSVSEQKATQEALSYLQQQVRTLQLQLGRQQAGNFDANSPEGRSVRQAEEGKQGEMHTAQGLKGGKDEDEGERRASQHRDDDGPTIRPEQEPERGATGPSVDAPKRQGPGPGRPRKVN